MPKSKDTVNEIDEIDCIDLLEEAINQNKGVMGLLRHMICSELMPTPTELDALYEVLNLTASNLSDIQDAMQTEAGKQGTEYWRGYEDGKEAAAASARQKAAIAGE